MKILSDSGSNIAVLADVTNETRTCTGLCQVGYWGSTHESLGSSGSSLGLCNIHSPPPDSLRVLEEPVSMPSSNTGISVVCCL